MVAFFPPPQQQNPVDPDQIEPAKAIRTLKLICSTMTMGVLLMLAISLILPAEAHAAAMMLSYLGAGGALFQVVLHFIIPDFVARFQLKNLATKKVANIDGHLFVIFQTKMIIGLVLLEVAVFFNLIAYVSEKQWWTRAVMGGLILLMAMLFPTLQQFESWADDKKREMQNQF